MLHADVHVGAYVRVFGQLHSALESGRRGGPSPVDEDKLDLDQAFLDIALPLGEGRTLPLRGGRQEMSYSSARLIDVRQGPTADWQINRHLNLTTIYAHFFPGSFLRETGPAEPIDFIEFTLSLTF